MQRVTLMEKILKKIILLFKKIPLFIEYLDILAM